ncbi:hypothetical protein [Aquipuribacter hungaricus]|uniref:Uncharacterized protein n=1 Tax=Aquipuribacter hungaricus TaxID=545624 RepID=A0ABV7WL94_9MICO
MSTVDQVDQPAAPDEVSEPPAPAGAVAVRRRRAQLHRVAATRVSLVPVPRSPGTGRAGRHVAVPAGR